MYFSISNITTTSKGNLLISLIVFIIALCYNQTTMNARKRGKVIVPADAEVWPHEYQTARALSAAGYEVEFMPTSKRSGQRTADCYIDNEKWEMKSPRSSSIKAVERNLKRGRWQSDKIVFDSRRMKRLLDRVIEREIRKRLPEIDNLKIVKFVNRHGKVIDIK
jgi:hypothetical protein